MNAEISGSEQGNGVRSRNGARTRALLILAGVFVAAGLAWLLLWLFVFSQRQTTDNAYVDGNIVGISAQVPGTVVEILADDTQRVEEGQVLVRLDPTDADVRLSQAGSALAQAVRAVRQQVSSASSADAQVAAAAVAQRKAQEDLARHEPLLKAQATSPEIIQHLRQGLRQAQANLESARAQAAAARAAVEDTEVAAHPLVEQARADFRAAWVAAQRNTIYAPVSGYVAQRSVQLGQSVQPGQPLLRVVPLQSLWVNANFKETQLRHMRIGQPVTLSADVYGRGVKYRGTVAGIGAGTGSVFSLLPAQNATGNWIKVVQRVPVRITLDAQELAERPLRIGLSMHAAVDITDRSGPALAVSPAREPVAGTSLYAHLTEQADERAAQIIDANLGRPAE
ncbi:HlyD family efflux transporter periplasmic adaptor subunit [Sinimarinibacterium flocculans]|jgi:membrane fusion protein (multidrug efflux system)|uniref:HlyD family efflux transporter periplasmic adaptor subunit n=1 Tax=Sinimarinibacterium flocculans TaxID=985250 RepID=UPI0035133BC5